MGGCCTKAYVHESKQYAISDRINVENGKRKHSFPSGDITHTHEHYKLVAVVLVHGADVRVHITKRSRLFYILKEIRRIRIRRGIKTTIYRLHTHTLCAGGKKESFFAEKNFSPFSFHLKKCAHRKETYSFYFLALKKRRRKCRKSRNGEEFDCYFARSFSSLS